MHKPFAILSVLNLFLNLILWSLISTQCAHADLIVVQDGGGQPLSQYIDFTTIPTPATIQAQTQNTDQAIDPTSLQIPASQSEFTPGDVTRHPVSTHFPHPFYVIGSDDLSLAWANTNAAWLKSNGAVGLIVGVNSPETIKSIETATGLSLIPGNIAGISSILKTTHYPFLVSNGWVTQ